MICSTVCIPKRGAERKRANYHPSDVESRKRADRNIITSNNLGCFLHVSERRCPREWGLHETQVTSCLRIRPADKFSWVPDSTIFQKKSLHFQKTPKIKSLSRDVKWLVESWKKKRRISYLSTAKSTKLLRAPWEETRERGLEMDIFLERQQILQESIWGN